ncbi:MAG: polysaccharide deacetylase family protein, partial [Myxococcales bacterium]|nr:polysaccharide deacetylase family protein [Myxococcales bacterium]
YRIRGTAITPAELLGILERTADVISLGELERTLADGYEPPRGRILTFDDGYREHHDVVAPLLESRWVTATFYVATQMHAEGAVAAVDAWYWALDNATRPMATMRLPTGTEFRGAVDRLEGKTAWVAGAPKMALLAATPEQQRVMVSTLADSLGCGLPEDLAARLYMRREEWRDLAARGHRIGAHSVHHPRLTQLDAHALQREVEESVRTVAELGEPVAFAYPDGALDDRVVAAVRRAGVSSAVTCMPGVATAGVELLRLPREFVSPSPDGVRPLACPQ